MITKEETLDRIQAALAGLPATVVDPRDGMPTLEVERDVLHAVLERLKLAAGFETITLVTCVDRLGARNPGPRFEVVHQLQSIANNDRVRVRTRVTEDEASVASCVDLWPGAGFMEREAYDMFGVRFEGHPDLRRILMWETYAEGHPLRKDFPLRGRFSRSEQVRQALNANPEAHYSMEELSIAEEYVELPLEMRERLARGERGTIPDAETP
jgi:NADH-quinone oxidoreductase subunit C